MPSGYVPTTAEEKADAEAAISWGDIIFARNGDLPAVRHFVRSDAEAVHQKDGDYYGMTALMWAAACGHLSLAQFLVKEKADVNAKDIDGQTALDRARKNGKTDMVAFLERAAKDTTHLEAELAATKAKLERMQLTAASPSTSGGYAGQAFATAPAPKASSQAAGSEAIPDGAAAPVSMFSARFNGGEFELKFREVHRLLKEHNFDNLMVNADAGDNFGTLTLEYFGRVHFENGVMLCVCTEDYGEITKSKYSSNYELQYIYDQNLRKIPIRVVPIYPPRPDCGPRHMYDKSYSARVLVNSVFKDSVVFLDCQDKTAHEIALMLAKKLLAM
ncbi:unnamed protein product [Durusdinium trenchii]|uniref:Uncharacterized protein n=1 Tax=Durusdinium trenchii TaxID=1381693 RepID=A0ABP0QEK2_9DINO